MNWPLFNTRNSDKYYCYAIFNKTDVIDVQNTCYLCAPSAKTRSETGVQAPSTNVRYNFRSENLENNTLENSSYF